MSSSEEKIDGAPSDGDIQREQANQHDDQTDVLPNATAIECLEDSRVMDAFDSLSQAIDQLVDANFVGAHRFIPRKKDHKEFFDALTAGDYKRYLTCKSPGPKEAIVTASIWHRLVAALLSTPLKAFIASIPENKIRDRLSDAKQDFYAWRTFTAKLLSTHHNAQDSWDEGGSPRVQFVQGTASLLLGHMTTQDVEAVQGSLDNIAATSYRLATAIASSTGCWVCSMADAAGTEMHGLELQPDFMVADDLWNEVPGDGPAGLVDLVKTPVLLKFGTIDSESFDQYRVFHKAQVVVVAPESEEVAQ